MSADEPIAEQAAGNNPEELSRLLEIELIQKRVAWQKTLARNKNIKTLSIFFLFLVFMAGVAAFYFVFMEAKQGRRERPAQTAESR